METLQKLTIDSSRFCSLEITALMRDLFPFLHTFLMKSDIKILVRMQCVSYKDLKPAKLATCPKEGASQEN